MSTIHLRKLTTLPDFHRCVELQRAIWNESDLETEPYVTFVVANQTGGQVLGAFDNDTMIGFSMSLVGLRDNSPYLHSHMTGVLPSYRDKGVGRQLKLFQREEALSRSIRRIEWTFDPLEVRNAHFNLNRLGAIARHIIPNFYGLTSSPLHRNLPTDRLLAEWHLDSPRVFAAIENIPQRETPVAATIQLPKIDSSSPLAEIQSRLRTEFQTNFAKHYAATSMKITDTHANYLLQPYSDY